MRFSLTESDRFKLNVYREIIEDGDIDIHTIKTEVERNKIDLLILRINSSLKSINYKLTELPYDVIHCDNLVYYQCDLKKHISTDLLNELLFIPFSLEHIPVLKTIIPIIFNNYKNHYFSNPIINKENIVDGYIEWMINNIIDEHYSENLWLVFNADNEVVGFAKCNYNKAESYCEGLLYGVLPNFSNKGIYTDLIRFTKNHYREIGIDTMKVSTQLTNYSVQRVWVKEKFNLSHSYDTYHINIY
jgi:hypothetical protein